MVDQFIYSNKLDEFVANCTIEDINATTPVSNSLLEISVNENKLEYFQYMIKKVMNLEQHNLSKAIGSISQILEKRIQFLHNEFKAGYSRLHIAVVDGEEEMIRYILKHNLICVNISDVPIGTPLHLAILLGHIDCIEALSEFDIDVDIVNKHNQTALHMALEHKIIAQVPYLILRSRNIDQVRYMGLTTMQFAIVHNCRFLYSIFMDVGADIFAEIQTFDDKLIKEVVEKYFEGKTCLPITNVENSLSLCLKLYGEIDPVLLSHLSRGNVNITDGNGNTLLHLAASLQNVDLVEIIIGCGANVNFINNFGENPFQEMLRVRASIKNSIKMQVAIGTTLIKAGIEVSINNWDNNFFKSALLLNNEKFMILVLENVHKIDFNEVDFKAIVKRRWFLAANKLLSIMPTSLGKSILTSDIIDFYINYAKPNEITVLLSNESIQPELLLNCPEQCLNKVIPKILNQLADRNEMIAFQSFLLVKLSNPDLLVNGETLLTNLIKKEKFDFVQSLLESDLRDFYINTKNKSAESPLYLSIITKNKSLIDILAVEYLDYNIPDFNGEAVFSLFFKNFTNKEDLSFLEKTAKIMIVSGASPFDKDSSNKTALDYCFNANVKARILSFAQKKSSMKCELECKICLSRPVEFVLECGHIYCSVCAVKCKICPACRNPSKSNKKIFF